MVESSANSTSNNAPKDSSHKVTSNGQSLHAFFKKRVDTDSQPEPSNNIRQALLDPADRERIPTIKQSAGVTADVRQGKELTDVAKQAIDKVQSKIQREAANDLVNQERKRSSASSCEENIYTGANLLTGAQVKPVVESIEGVCQAMAQLQKKELREEAEHEKLLVQTAIVEEQENLAAMMDEDDVERCSDEDNQSLDSYDADEYEHDESERAKRRRERIRRKRALTNDDDEAFELTANGPGCLSDANSSDDNPMDALEQEELSDLDDDEAARAEKQGAKRKQKELQKKFKHRHRAQALQADIDDDNDAMAGEKSGAIGGDQNGDTIYIDNLPNDPQQIKAMLREVRKHIIDLEKQFFEEEASEDEHEETKESNHQTAKMMSPQNSEDPQTLELTHAKVQTQQHWCIPISVNVVGYDFDKLVEAQLKNGGRLFDVITIDPPWQLSSANPTRGVAIAYSTLSDLQILNDQILPFNKLQTDGFLFIWVINAKYRLALELFDQYGYTYVDEITWVKQTVNGKIAKGHGYYLQHAKETCLIGYKGDLGNRLKHGGTESDIIFSQRRGQSQKPEEMYEYVESLVPNGCYLEIFGRRNNLHNGWVTLGNEL